MSTEELHLKTLKSLKKDELKAELEKRGLETTGLKKVLRERLERYLSGPNLNLQTSQDVASLPEEELREELLKRNLETGGSVTTLRERLTDAITHSNAVSTKFNLDILTKIAEMSPDPRELIRVLLLSNKKWSEALLNDTKFLKLYYRSREPLLLKEVQEIFALSAAKAKNLPHTQQWRCSYVYGEYKVLQFEAGETFMRIMEQHGGMEGWKNRKEQKRNRKIAAQKGKRKREEREGEERKERIAKLKFELDKLGVERRGDSSLCDGYENSTGTAQYWTAAAVARKMAEMKFLYGYTDYERRLDELCDLTAECEGAYPGMRRDAADDLQSKYTFPETWPWLNEK